MTERMLDIERAQALERMHTVERLAAGVAKGFNEAVSEIAIHSQKVLEKAGRSESYPRGKTPRRSSRPTSARSAWCVICW